MPETIDDDLRDDLAAIGRFLTHMETGRRQHPPKLLATRLLRIERRLPADRRRESLIPQVASMIFDGQLDPLTERAVLRMAWAATVRILAKSYGFRVIDGTASENSSRAA